MFGDMNAKQINDLSRALTHYIFRSGAVEDMHAAGKLSQGDMKALNKDIHNRIAGLIVALKGGRIGDVQKLLSLYSLYGSDWDECVSYLDEFDAV